jgi:hypothetical protein
MLEHAEANGFSVAAIAVNAVVEKYGIKISLAESRKMQEAAEKERERLLALASSPFPASSRYQGGGVYTSVTDEEWQQMDEIVDACRVTGTTTCWSEHEINYYRRGRRTD